MKSWQSAFSAEIFGCAAPREFHNRCITWHTARTARLPMPLKPRGYRYSLELNDWRIPHTFNIMYIYLLALYGNQSAVFMAPLSIQTEIVTIKLMNYVRRTSICVYCCDCCEHSRIIARIGILKWKISNSARHNGNSVELSADLTEKNVVVDPHQKPSEIQRLRSARLIYCNSKRR